MNWNFYDVYDVTDSTWVSIRFQSRVLRFCSTDGSSDRYYMSSQIFSPHFFSLVLMHLVWLVRFVAQISTFFSILVRRMCVLLSQSLLCTFLLSPAQLAWSQMGK
jgi:hypothetical protein